MFKSVRDFSLLLYNPYQTAENKRSGSTKVVDYLNQIRKETIELNSALYKSYKSIRDDDLRSELFKERLIVFDDVIYEINIFQYIFV